MSDWMDELRESVTEEKKRKDEEEESKRREESRRRNTIGQLFQELDRSVQQAIPLLNQKVYEGRREVVFRYMNNTITGDHFLVTLKALRFYVRLNSQEHRIECNLEYFLSQKQNYFSANSGGEDFFVTTDGNNVVLVHKDKKEPVTQIDQITQKLLSTIVRAAES